MSRLANISQEAIGIAENGKLRVICFVILTFNIFPHYGKSDFSSNTSDNNNQSSEILLSGVAWSASTTFAG